MEKEGELRPEWVLGGGGRQRTFSQGPWVGTRLVGEVGAWGGVLGRNQSRGSGWGLVSLSSWDSGLFLVGAPPALLEHTLPLLLSGARSHPHFLPSLHPSFLPSLHPPFHHLPPVPLPFTSSLPVSLPPSLPSHPASIGSYNTLPGPCSTPGPLPWPLKGQGHRDALERLPPGAQGTFDERLREPFQGLSQPLPAWKVVPGAR